MRTKRNSNSVTTAERVCRIPHHGGHHFRSHATRRRGVTAVFTLVTLFVLLGFAALTIDVGAMYNARADLQDAADAAAISAAMAIMENSDGNPTEIAKSVAERITANNRVFGKSFDMSAGDAIVFGTAEMDPETRAVNFAPGNDRPNAVRVTVGLNENSPNGPLSLYFARIFGKHNTEMSASATAGLAARDINLVVDLSGSISYDSQLRNYPRTRVNLFELWAALPVDSGVSGIGNGIEAPPAADPAFPNPDPGSGPGRLGNTGGYEDLGASAVGGQQGPTWGWMYDWGSELSTSYTPTTDPGLVYFPPNADWNNEAVIDWLERVGYTPAEIEDLTSSAVESTWDNRVAVAMGLARWDSGIRGGLWEGLAAADRRNGDGDSRVEDGEITWLVDYPFENGSWTDYLNNYVAHRNANMLRGSEDFRYRVGLKTFMDYLLVRQPANDQTPELSGTPMQPLNAIKEAGGFLTEFLAALEGNDNVALTSYATSARHEVDLTSEMDQISSRLYGMQAKHYGDGRTNIGGGIGVAMEELLGDNARHFAQKVIILLTDGIANVGESSNGNDVGRAYALQMAEVAAARNIRIITVSVGVGADRELMEQIAEIGNGAHFHAEGDIDTYSAELEDIFQAIGEMRIVQLLE